MRINALGPQRIISKSMNNANEFKVNVFDWISSNFFGTEAREIIEALLGKKVSRLYLRLNSLNALDNAARRYGFGLSVGGVKHVLSQNRGKWSDTITSHVPLSAAHGLFVAYIARNLSEAEKARQLDEKGAHEDFGTLLGIPKCCITRFCEQWRRSSNSFDSMTYLVNNRNCNLINFIKWQNNVLGQFSQRSLVSYIPCKLDCQHTREFASSIYKEISSVAPMIAKHCLRGHKKPYLSEPSGNIVEMTWTVNSANDSSSLMGFDGESSWQVTWKGDLRDEEHNRIDKNFTILKDSVSILETEIKRVQIIIPEADEDE